MFNSVTEKVKWLRSLEPEQLAEELSRETDPCILDSFREHEAECVRLAIGKNAHVFKETLSKMFFMEASIEVLTAIAGNTSTPVLVKHSIKGRTDLPDKVKIALITCPTTPDGIRNELIEKGSDLLRFAAAQCKLTGKKTLKSLFSDLSEHNYIRNAAAETLQALQQ